MPGFTVNAVPGLTTRSRNALDALGIAAMATLLVVDGVAPRSWFASACAALALYALALSALLRVLASIVVASAYASMLWVSGFLWALAFALYLIHYVPVLLAPRPDGRPG